jgi:iron complex outermembrane receptor protein
VAVQKYLKKNLSEGRFLINGYPKPNQTMEKPMTRNVLKPFGLIRVALAVAVGLPVLIVSNVFAQAPPPGPPPAGAQAEVERVIVTGSNIPTAEEVTAAPVDTLNTAVIERSGSQDILNIITKTNPDFVGAGNIGNSNANISSGTTLGGSTITIRGLPTLILFENRRIADDAAIAVGGAQFTDVNLFPVALVSRIEVLKDGASAIYGSEAVGGVVNIFAKDDFTGLEIGYRYGFTVESGVAERRGYVIAGVGNDTTHVTAGFQYYEIDPLFARERAYSSPPRGLFAGVTTTYAGSGRDAGPGGDGGGRYLLLPGLNSPFDAGVLPGSVVPDAGAQFAQIPQAYAPATVGEVTSFNLSTKPTNTLQVENTNAYASFSHQICGKQLEAFGNVIYSHNDSESFLNAQPLSNGTGVVILGSLRVNPLDPSGPLIPEDRGSPAPFTPFQESIDGNSLSGVNRLIMGQRYQTNPRIFSQSSNFYRVLGGLRSQINKDWYVEGAVYYSHYELAYLNQNLVNAPQLNAMIAGTAVDAGGNPIPALDFFARQPVGTGPGQVSQTQFNTIFGSNLRDLTSYQRAFDGKIVGFPFELPGGPIGVAVGGGLSINGFKVNDSPEIFIGSVPILEIVKGRAVDSAYAEVRVPIVGSQMNIPFIYNLEVSAAGRFDHYEHVKEDAKVPKVTARYQPFPDLTLRATYSNSFIAPTIYQLFGPNIQGFSDTITFPGAPVQDQAQVIAGSNPDLVPSKAESYTAGLVYSPHFVPGLVITADFFRTLQQKIVTAFGGQKILNSVNALGPASPFASQVALNNFPGSAGAIAITAPGQLVNNLQSTFYFDPIVNIGAARIEGWDLSAHYTMDLRSWGQLELGINSVVFIRYDLKSSPEAQFYNILGLNFTEFGGIQGGGAFPDYKVNFLAEYRFQGWTLSANANYIPELLNATGADPEFSDQSTFATIQDYITVDGRLSYEFKRTPPPPPAVPDAKDAKDGKGVVPGVAAVGGCNWVDKMVDGLTLTVGCNNIFDEDPRFVNGANSATNLAIYDPYGRFVYLEVSKKF